MNFNSDERYGKCFKAIKTIYVDLRVSETSLKQQNIFTETQEQKRWREVCNFLELAQNLISSFDQYWIHLKKIILRDCFSTMLLCDAGLRYNRGRS